MKHSPDGHSPGWGGRFCFILRAREIESDTSLNLRRLKFLPPLIFWSYGDLFVFFTLHDRNNRLKVEFSFNRLSYVHLSGWTNWDINNCVKTYAKPTQQNC